MSDRIQLGGISLDPRQIDELFAELRKDAPPPPPAPPPNPDIEVAIVVRPVLAKAGGWQELEIARRVLCPTCNTGNVYREAPRESSAARTCDRCAGGFVTREEKLRLRIPAETKPGQVLRLAGKGHEQEGGASGNLLVEVLVEGASSGVGPLRVPLDRAGALPERCFVCAGQHGVARVPVAVRRGPGAPGVDLPLCPRHRERVEDRASAVAGLRGAAMVAAVVLVLPVFFALQAHGALTAIAAGAAMSLAAVAVVRWAFARADARSPLCVRLDEDRRELIFPPLGAARAEE